MKLPNQFEEKMKSLLGEEYKDYIACYDEPRHYGLRVNTAKISVEKFKEICPFAIRPIPWIANGFYYDGEKDSPAKHPYYYAGLYYLQEPSAMTPASRLPVNEGEKVLDLCAAPGGKATELGAKLNGTGMLLANDISASRAKGLLKNLEIFGVGNVFVTSETPEVLAKNYPAFFDKIIIDAPCSGEGMFRKDRKMVKAWEEHGPSYFAPIQREILCQASSMLKPGGMLLYSTCTFDEMENEQSIAFILEQCPDFKLVDMEGYQGFSKGLSINHEEFEMEKTVRIFPHRMEGEGHFLALLKKSGEYIEEKNKTKCTPLKKEYQLVEEFCNACHISVTRENIFVQKEMVFLLPQGVVPKKGLHYLRTGLFLGYLKKNRFEPSQALAMTLKKGQFYQEISFSVEDDRVIRYLKGETLPVEDLVEEKAKGWYLVMVDNYPLGWGKINQGSLKNKYLASWRWMGA